MLANSGLKYAYAQSKGRWVNMGDHKVYIEGDLDRSRKKVCFLYIWMTISQQFVILKIVIPL